LGVTDPAQRSEVSALVADDDEMNANLLVRILESGGFGQVSATTSSSDVMGLIAENNPDLLLLDVSMPSPNGFELLARIAKLEVQPVTVILTGHEHPSIERQAIELGAAAMVGKTASREVLLAKIDDALAARTE
jgi:two-component system response regulator EvgA